MRVRSKPCAVEDSECVTLCYVEFVTRYVEFVTLCEYVRERSCDTSQIKSSVLQCVAVCCSVLQCVAV